jgi:hypothetical protein
VELSPKHSSAPRVLATQKTDDRSFLRQPSAMVESSLQQQGVTRRASAEEGKKVSDSSKVVAPEKDEVGEEESCSTCTCERMEGEEPPVCRFCLSEEVPAITRSASCCRRSTWATDSFLQNAVVPTILRIAKFFRRRFRPKALQAQESREQSASTDPHRMLAPCLCKGSQQFVHHKCLQYWISQRLAKGVPAARAYRCPVCQEQYCLPSDFHVGEAGRVQMGKGPLRVLATAGQWYFSSWFLFGGIKGLGATAGTAFQLAASPLCLFPGLPLNVFTQVVNSRPEAAQTFALTCVGAPLVPVYTRLALQASGFMCLKGYCLGGLMGSVLGGKHLLTFISRAVNKMLVGHDRLQQDQSTVASGHA